MGSLEPLTDLWRVEEEEKDRIERKKSWKLDKKRTRGRGRRGGGRRGGGEGEEEENEG